MSGIFFRSPGSPHFAEEPDLGVTPMALDGCTGDTEYIRRLFLGEAGKVAELHELGLDRVLALGLRRGLVGGQEVLGRGRGRNLALIEIPAFELPAVPLGPLAAGVLDEDATHRLGRR